MIEKILNLCLIVVLVVLAAWLVVSAVNAVTKDQKAQSYTPIDTRAMHCDVIETSKAFEVCIREATQEARQCE